MGFLIVAIVVIFKAVHDTQAWGHVDHNFGAVVISLVLVPTMLIESSFYPAVFYGVVWNPIIAMMNGLPVFYIGNTAKTDKILKAIFGMYAGIIWFITLLIMLIITI